MNDYRYVDIRYLPILGRSLNPYIFQVNLEMEDDGRWSAGVPALPGCTVWGYTREEALRNIRDAVEAFLPDIQKTGEEISCQPVDNFIR